MKHLYFNFSKSDYIPILQFIDNFVSIHHYSPDMRCKAFINELGFIIKDGVYFHFLYGPMQSKKCHFCDSSEDMEFIIEKQKFSKPYLGIIQSRAFMQCNRCESRGPIIYMKNSAEVELDLYRSIVETRYKSSCWDQNLKNPYTSMEQHEIS